MLDYASFFVPPALPGLRGVHVGRLHVPSGQLYCCDPFLSDAVAVLAQAVPPGGYPVELCLAVLPDLGERVALARLLLSGQRVTQWQPAEYIQEGARQSTFPVDAGLACFMDREAASLLTQAIDAFYRNRRDDNYYTNLLAPEFARSATRPGSDGDWAMHAPVPGNPANVAMFASGLGDGVYGAWWGLDEAGEPAMLVADFGLLEASPQQVS